MMPPFEGGGAGEEAEMRTRLKTLRKKSGKFPRLKPFCVLAAFRWTEVQLPLLKQGAPSRPHSPIFRLDCGAIESVPDKGGGALRFGAGRFGRDSASCLARLKRGPYERSG